MVGNETDGEFWSDALCTCYVLVQEIFKVKTLLVG